MTVRSFLLKETRLAMAPLVRLFLTDAMMDIIMFEPRIYTKQHPDRLKIAPTVILNNVLLNVSSGNIEMGDYTFCAHDVSLITGAHDYTAFYRSRINSVPMTGRDIIIGKGVWLASGCMVLGPCKIGDNSVIGAGAIVTPGMVIPPRSLVVGIPARVIRTIEADPIMSCPEVDNCPKVKAELARLNTPYALANLIRPVCEKCEETK
jgi:acetyltransferase-like isoleucine patch superfamily enzyme